MSTIENIKDFIKSDKSIYIGNVISDNRMLDITIQRLLDEDVFRLIISVENSKSSIELNSKQLLKTFNRLDSIAKEKGAHVSYDDCIVFGPRTRCECCSSKEYWIGINRNLSVNDM